MFSPFAGATTIVAIIPGAGGGVLSVTIPTALPECCADSRPKPRGLFRAAVAEDG
jgi:hypothetical protein